MYSNAKTLTQCTKVHFASLRSGVFTTIAVINDRKRNRQIAPLCSAECKLPFALLWLIPFLLQLMLRTITKQGKLGLKSVVQSRADYNGVCTLAVKTTVNCG